MIERCPGCAATFAPYSGATHPYIGASAACWHLHSAVLSGYPPDEEVLRDSSPLTVAADAYRAPPGPASLLLDAYAAQHHGEPSPKAIQSVAVHLLALHGVMSRQVDPSAALWVRQQAVRRKGVYHWLTPPPAEQALSLRHCFPSAGGVQVASRIEAYVGSVHAAWTAAHGAQLARWYDEFVLGG